MADCKYLNIYKGPPAAQENVKVKLEREASFLQSVPGAPRSEAYGLGCPVQTNLVLLLYLTVYTEPITPFCFLFFVVLKQTYPWLIRAGEDIYEWYFLFAS